LFETSKLVSIDGKLQVDIPDIYKSGL